MSPSGDVNTTLPLVLNILGVLPCCAGGWLAFIGLIFAILAGGAKKKGDLADAQNKAKVALILGIVSMVLGLIGWTVYVLLVVLEVAGSRS
jgi:hypothetical protein